MDGIEFDTLTRSLQTLAGRRTTLGLLVGSAFGLIGHDVNAGKGKKKKKKKKKPQGSSPPVSPPPTSPPQMSPPPPASPPPGPPPPTAAQRTGCFDGVKNRSETDIDCGGPTCPTCDIDQSCQHSIDCASGVCRTDTKTCGVCAVDNQCGFDFNGQCRCDPSSGRCNTNVEPTTAQLVNSCSECDPDLVCASFVFGQACLPGCGSSEICTSQDFCRGDTNSDCGSGGKCFQPLGGGPTRCGRSAHVKCGCTSNQECVDLLWEGAYCAQFNPALAGCSCAGHTSFCAAPA
jgi:hypothetical protein